MKQQAKRLCKAVENLNQKCDETMAFPHCDQVTLIQVVNEVKSMVQPGEHWVIHPSIQKDKYLPCGIYMANHQPYWAYGDTWDECFEKFRKDKG